MEKLFDLEPDGAMVAFADMMRKKVAIHVGAPHVRRFKVTTLFVRRPERPPYLFDDRFLMFLILIFFRSGDAWTLDEPLR